MSFTENALTQSGLAERRALEESSRYLWGKTVNTQGKLVDGVFEDNLMRFETRELFDRLDSVSINLFRFPSLVKLEAYRAVVGEIMSRAEKMMETRREFSVNGSRARMLIERTRKSLDELEDVLEREGKRSRIAGITDEIRGCLVSLLA
ncbi:MAG: DUF327 family protein [Synergistota bacterium]|nr:DUF327 family protein [Synergistota bacterium]